MKRLQKISLLLLLPTANCALPTGLFAQLLDSAQFHAAPIFNDLNEALQNPDRVYRLSLHGKKLKVFPNEIFKFKNLQELDLSKNRIDSVPEGIGTLTNRKIFCSPSCHCVTG